MESIFTKDQPVLPSLCDYSANLSISSVASLFMDMAMYHAETLGIGFTGFNERGLFWVAVKTRIKILKKVPMAKMVQISTWPEEAGGFKCNRDYEITFEGEPVALGKTEWAIIDATTHRPQKSQGIYPEGLEIIDKNSIPEPFLNLKGDFEGELLGEYTIRSIDTDYGRHMNNVAYIRAIEGLFASDELTKRNFTDLEIHYKNPCFEGEKISFVGCEDSNGLNIKVLNEEGKISALALLK